MKRLITIAVAVILLLGLVATPALARPGTPPPSPEESEAGLQPLEQIPVYFAMFWSINDFESSVWSGYDEDGEYWDTSALKVTPNGQAVHDVLYFFQSELIERDSFKPYVLIHREDGFYSSEGQVINYWFTEEYGGAKRRAVVTTWLQLDEKGGEYDWMVYRADYYTRAEGAMEYFHTNIYTVWDAALGSAMSDTVSEALTALIEAGPANVGGQRPIEP